MSTPEPILLLSESRLRALLEDATERVARRVLQRASDPAAADRPGKAWLTNEEAIHYLGLSRPTLARYRADGKLRFSKVGSNVYYRLSDVEALLEANLQGR